MREDKGDEEDKGKGYNVREDKGDGVEEGKGDSRQTM